MNLAPVPQPYAHRRTHARRNESSSVRERMMGWSFELLLRSLGASCRVDTVGLDILDRLVDDRQRHIIAFWHGKYITLFPLLRNRPATVVTSLSSRGNIIANICLRSGMNAVSLPHRRNKHSFQLIRQAFNDCVEMGIAVDGPIGPDHIVKRGVIHLASQLGCSIVPVSVACRKKLVLKSRWDRLEIPYPFGQISMVVGRTINYPAQLSRTELYESAIHLQDALRTVDDLAERNVRN